MYRGPITAHVFTYRFPRIKEGLSHSEIPVNPWTKASDIPAPQGSYIRLQGKWYYRGVYTVRKGHTPPPIINFEPHHIPKEILAMALLLDP